MKKKKAVKRKGKTVKNSNPDPIIFLDSNIETKPNGKVRVVKDGKVIGEQG